MIDRRQPARFERPAWEGRPFVSCVCSLILVVAFGLFLAACRAPQSQEHFLQRFQFSSPHMGTLFHITLYAANQQLAEEAATAGFQRVAALNDMMSDYQADSELMQLAEHPPGTPVQVSPELFDVLQRAQHFAQASGGAFDVTIGPYVRLWRFSRKRHQLPSAAELAAARAAFGYQKIRLDSKTRSVTLLAPNMRLDLGGIAKGYAADQVLALLKGRGVSRALVAASGDIAAGDPPPGQAGWKIAITGLDSTNAATPQILLRNAAVSTSGDVEQTIEIDGTRYSHIVNPATGLGLTNRIQVTVVARDATTSDALATALSVLGKDSGLALVDKLPNAAARIVTRDRDRQQVFVSRKFHQLAPVVP